MTKFSLKGQYFFVGISFQIRHLYFVLRLQLFMYLTTANWTFIVRGHTGVFKKNTYFFFFVEQHVQLYFVFCVTTING